MLRSRPETGVLCSEVSMAAHAGGSPHSALPAKCSRMSNYDPARYLLLRDYGTLGPAAKLSVDRIYADDMRNNPDDWDPALMSTEGLQSYAADTRQERNEVESAILQLHRKEAILRHITSEKRNDAAVLARSIRGA